MEIDDEIVVVFPQAHRIAQDAEDAAVCALFVNQEAFVEMLVRGDDIRELLVREERDARRRVLLTQGGQHGRAEHEIAEVHEVDDENVLIRAHCPSIVSPCSISCHESVR